MSVLYHLGIILQTPLFGHWLGHAGQKIPVGGPLQSGLAMPWRGSFHFRVVTPYLRPLPINRVHHPQVHPSGKCSMKHCQISISNFCRLCLGTLQVPISKTSKLANTKLTHDDRVFLGSYLGSVQPGNSLASASTIATIPSPCVAIVR
jgi:hypothetical protein